MARKEEWSGAASRPISAREYSKSFEGLTASGAAVGGGGEADATAKSSATRQAQAQVWAFRRQIGELNHAIGFYENCFSRIRLGLAVEEDDGSRRPVFDEDGKELVKGATEALGHLRALRSPLGGSSHIMRAIGGCLGAVGECHLVGMDSDRMKTGRAWEVFSPSEFFEPVQASAPAPSQNGSEARAREYHRIRVPGQTPQIIKSTEAVVARIWQPDPEFSLLPWAPALGMLEIFDELVLLTREVAGAVRSRLALAGILLVANDIEYPERDDAEPDSDEASPFTADLMRVASAAIKDKNSAAGVVPLVVEVAANRVGENGPNGEQGFRLIEFSRQWDDKAAAKRDECIRRFAQGYDLPVEVVIGHQQTTFANAAQISADQYRNYIEPKALIATDGLTTGYLQAVLPGTEFVIHPDPTDLVVRPDQIGDWQNAFDRFAISFSSLRDKIGATDADAPDEEELALRIMLEVASRTRPAPGESIGSVAPTPAEIAGEVGPAGTSSEPQPKPQPALTASIGAAMEVEVRRVMQRVGARLRSKVSGRSGLASIIQQVPDPEVAATLGPRQVAQLMTEAELIGREFDVFHSWVAEQTDKVVADQYRRLAIEEAALRMNLPALAASAR